MDPAAFAMELQRVAAIVSRAEGGIIPYVGVPAVWTVQTEEVRFDVPALWLRRAIDAARRDPSGWKSRRETLLAQLAALESEAAALARSSPVHAATADGVSARAALARVLAGPEFKRMAQQSALASLRQQVWHWVLRTWERLGGARLGQSGTTIVFAWITVLLAFGALLTWLVRLINRPETNRRLDLPAPRARTRSARIWARDALSATDAREAARCAYRATVCRLEEEGAWRPDDTRTPREYLHLLPAGHRRLGLLTEVTRRFEEIWYGARDATEDDRQSLLTRLEELDIF